MSEIGVVHHDFLPWLLSEVNFVFGYYIVAYVTSQLKLERTRVFGHYFRRCKSCMWPPVSGGRWPFRAGSGGRHLAHRPYRPRLKLPTQSHMADTSLTIYILKFKFKAQIMNFTVIHQGHASCSHHVHTLYTHTVSFSITHLLHNAHYSRLAFCAFSAVLTYFTIQLPSLPFQKWRSQGEKLISSRIFFKFLNGRH